jgi:hypothetical protein
MRLLLLSLPFYFYIPLNEKRYLQLLLYLVFYITGFKCRVFLYYRDYAGFPLSCRDYAGFLLLYLVLLVLS